MPVLPVISINLLSGPKSIVNTLGSTVANPRQGKKEQGMQATKVSLRTCYNRNYHLLLELVLAPIVEVVVT
jgi:hypothetical protein